MRINGIFEAFGNISEGLHFPNAHLSNSKTRYEIGHAVLRFIMRVHGHERRDGEDQESIERQRIRC